ncbi:hypothetical protein SK128_001650, partial [Halocaridina rubra]
MYNLGTHRCQPPKWGEIHLWENDDDPTPTLNITSRGSWHPLVTSHSSILRP